MARAERRRHERRGERREFEWRQRRRNYKCTGGLRIRARPRDPVERPAESHRAENRETHRQQSAAGKVSAGAGISGVLLRMRRPGGRAETKEEQTEVVKEVVGCIEVRV